VPRPAPQTDRLIALFRLLAARPQQGYSVAEIARRIGVNRANLYPMVAALGEAGWLVYDPETKVYGLGPALVGLGDAAATGFPTLAFVRSVALKLFEELGVNSGVFTRSEGSATLAELVWDARTGVAPMRLGQSFPLRAPFGAGFVAWGEETTIKEWLGNPAMGVQPALDALEAVRRRGYVVEIDNQPEDQIHALIARLRQRSDGEDRLSDSVVEAMISDLAQRPDYLLGHIESGRRYRVRTIGAPIFGAGGEVTTFLVLFGFSGLMARRDIERLGRRVCREADQVTVRVGGLLPTGRRSEAAAKQTG
jgi:DNA-binding IclR family transcriptional regulator